MLFYMYDDVTCVIYLLPFIIKKKVITYILSLILKISIDPLFYSENHVFCDKNVWETLIF